MKESIMHATSAPVSECRDLYVSHDHQVENPAMVINGIQFAIAPGELVSIVGPSGSGKSTLLHTLAGFIRTCRGEVRLLGNDISQASQRRIAKIHRAGVGFVFQSYNLIPSLPAVENVLLPARFSGQRADKNSAALLLEKLGLASKITKRTGDLSGGEQQRVAVARVMYCKPKLVFADEPTGALDSRNGGQILDALQSLTDLGSAVCLVTHDLQAAARADRAIMLRDGRIQSTFINPTADALFTETLKVAADA